MKRHWVTQFAVVVLLSVGVGCTQSQQDNDSTVMLDDEPLDEVLAKAEQGDAEAQFNLGVRYDEGEGVPQDDEEAVRWYRLAADQGDADAQFNLGAMYAEGQGVPQDYVTRSTNVVKDLAPWLSGLGHRLHGGTM